MGSRAEWRMKKGSAILALQQRWQQFSKSQAGGCAEQDLPLGDWDVEADNRISSTLLLQRLVHYARPNKVGTDGRLRPQTAVLRHERPFYAMNADRGKNPAHDGNRTIISRIQLLPPLAHRVKFPMPAQARQQWKVLSHVGHLRFAIDSPVNYKKTPVHFLRAPFCVPGRSRPTPLHRAGKCPADRGID